MPGLGVQEKQTDVAGLEALVPAPFPRRVLTRLQCLDVHPIPGIRIYRPAPRSQHLENENPVRKRFGTRAGAGNTAYFLRPMSLRRIPRQAKGWRLSQIFLLHPNASHITRFIIPTHDCYRPGSNCHFHVNNNKISNPEAITNYGRNFK